MNKLLVSTAVIAIALLASPQALAQCGSDRQCQRIFTCFVADYVPNYRAEPSGKHCYTQGVTHCLAVSSASTTDYEWFGCNAMGARGAADSGLAGIFNPARTLTDKDGERIEFSKGTGEMLQVATGIAELQRRGAPIDGDVNASLEAAGIPTVEGARIELTEDADTGERAFTVRGASMDDFVLRFDARGKPVIDERGSAPAAAAKPDTEGAVEQEL
jgi:hypothetical protein